MKPTALTFLLQALPNSTEAVETWIGWVTSHLLHPLILFAVAAGIAARIGLFVAEASWNKPSTPNFRAVAAAILPLLAGIWTFMYWPGLFETVLRSDRSGIVTAVVIGFSFSLYPISRRHNEWRTILGAFFSAGLFSILVFGYAASGSPEVFRVYYALAIGFLVRLTLFGRPRPRYKFEVYEIRPGPRRQYRLYFDGALYFHGAQDETFSSASDAATTLKKRTGHTPEDIDDWEVVYRWQLRSFFPPAATSKSKVQ